MDPDSLECSRARLGAVLKGKYTLDRVLGVGGMATVYAATHRNGKEFAVKVLHADLSLRADTRTRFLREGYLANRVNHPGSVAILDDDVAEDGAAFLVMELVHGQTLEAIWERRGFRLSLPFVVGVGLQILDVLAAAHARTLIHRDIKPSNVMLTHAGQIKVLDFGIARLRDMTNVRKTATGMVMGTPAFMAPEHARANTDEIGGQTDLWAVGATMFTLATGLLVHEAPNAQQILVKAATTPARPFLQVMPSAPESVARAVDKALAFERRDRWESATEMQAALRDAAREAFDVVPTAETLLQLLNEPGEHEKRFVLGPTAREIARIYAGGGSDAPQPPGADTRGGGPEAAQAHGALPESGENMIPTPGPVGALVETDEPDDRVPVIALVTGTARAADLFARRAVPKQLGLMAAALIVGSLGVAGILFVATRDPQPRGEQPAAWAPHPTVATAPPSLSTSASSMGSARTAPLVAVSTLVELRPAPAPRTPSVPVTALAAPRPPPRPSALAATATAPPPEAAPNKPDCNPPYEFDEGGNKRWKRGCL